MAQTDAAANDLVKAVLGLRGRRACALCGQLAGDASVTDVEREALAAAAHETYIRELLDSGHAKVAVEKARALYDTSPQLCDRWALSLRVRLGLIENCADTFGNPAWREQLRRELVDPADLLTAPADDASADARTVMDAWQLIDGGQAIDARRKLATIGRRSLLVDWRLFLQAYQAARDGQAGEAEAALGRIAPDTPAAHLARTLRACLAQDDAALSGTELSGLPVHNAAAYRPMVEELSRACVTKGEIRRIRTPLENLIGALLSARRPAAANGVLRSVYRAYPRHSILDAGVAAGIPFAQAGICAILEEADADAWEFGLPEVLRMHTWQPREHAVLRLRQIMEMRRRCESRESAEFGLDDDDEEWRVDRGRVEGWCREVNRLWPMLRETYSVWRWAESHQRSCRAEKAEAVAFPEDPDVWRRLIRRLADLALFKEAENALAALLRLPGTEAERPRMEAWIAYCRVVHAFDRNHPFLRLVDLADAYTGDDRFEQVGISVRLWLRAPDRKTRRQRGEDMAAIGAPWLVAFFCHYLSATGTSPRALPAAVQRALSERSGAVAENFLALAQRPERLDTGTLRPGLVTALLDALESPDCPIPLTADCMRELTLARWHGSRYAVLFGARDRFLSITARLLTGADRPTPSAVCALALRAVLYRATAFPGTTSNGPCVAILKAAAGLAEGPNTKAVVQEVADLIGLTGACNVDRRDDGFRTVCEDIWRRQCTIRCTDDFVAHREQEHGGRSRVAKAPPGMPKRVARLINSILNEDEDEDEDWDWDAEEDEDRDWDEDADDPEDKPPKPTPMIDLSKSYPASEIEFERLIDLTACADPALRVGYDADLKRKIAEATLSDKSKRRLLQRLERSRQQVNNDAPF